MKSMIRACMSAIAVLFTAWSSQTIAQETAPENKSAAVAPAPAQPPKAATPSEPAVRVIQTDKDNKEEAVVSMTFDETPLADVIKAFRDATGANIISSGTNLQGSVSVRLDNVPWRKGLASILDPQNMQLVEQPAGSGIYVITAKTVEVPKITRTFELNHAKANDVANLFKLTLGNVGVATPFPSANVIIVTAPEQQIGECERILKAIDKPSPQVYIEARFVELSAAASKKLGMKWDSLGTDDGWGVKVTDVGLGYSDTSSRSKVRGHSKTSGSSHNDTLSGSSSSSSSLSDSLVDSFENDLRDTSGSSTSSGSSDNSLSQTFEDIVSGSLSDTLDRSRTHTRDRTFTGSMSMTDFALTMNAFEEMDGASVFKNPKIIVANEQTARIDMTTKEPNVEVDYQAATTDGQRDSVSTKLGLIPGKTEPFVGEAFFSYGITLTVTPRISPSGLISVTIEPSLSELESYYQPSGVTEDMPASRFPIIKMQRIQTMFTMQKGTTAVIGGLSRTYEDTVENGIPLLRKIPWIGPRLFGWKGRSKEQREIIIFVTIGLADPASLPEDIGMPKNAILSRGLFTGKVKEPGDRTVEEVLSIEDPKPAKKAKTVAPLSPTADAAVTEREAAQTPLLKK